MDSEQSTYMTDMFIRTLKEKLRLNEMLEPILLPQSGPFPAHPLRVAMYPGEIRFIRFHHIKQTPQQAWAALWKEFFRLRELDRAGKL